MVQKTLQKLYTFASSHQISNLFFFLFFHSSPMCLEPPLSPIMKLIILLLQAVPALSLVTRQNRTSDGIDMASFNRTASFIKHDPRPSPISNNDLHSTNEFEKKRKSTQKIITATRTSVVHGLSAATAEAQIASGISWEKLSNEALDTDTSDAALETQPFRRPLLTNGTQDAIKKKPLPTSSSTVDGDRTEDPFRGILDRDACVALDLLYKVVFDLKLQTKNMHEIVKGSQVSKMSNKT